MLSLKLNKSFIYSETSTSETLDIGIFKRTLSKVCQGRMQLFAASRVITKMREGDCNSFFPILALKTN